MLWKLHMKIFVLASVLLLAMTGAHAQSINGNGNGNFNSGTGSGNGNGNGNGNGSTNTINYGARGNTPSVIAPSLAAAGIESCLGSTSVGGAGSGFGVTIAGTITDKACNLRLFSRTLYNLGHRTAATQILCNDPEVAQALLVEGVHCHVGIGAEMERAALVAAAEDVVGGQPVPCRNYVLFRGCLDPPPAPVVTGALAALPEAVDLRPAERSHRTASKRRSSQ